MFWEKVRAEFQWDSRNIIFIAVLLLIPISLIMVQEQRLALLSIISLIPAAIAGVAPKRKKRVSIVLVGLFMGISILIGAIIKFYMTEIGAAVFIFLLAFAAALIAAKRNSPIVMTFIVPVIGIGLSMTTIESALAFMIVIAINAVFAFGVSLIFPEREVVAQQPQAIMLTEKDAKLYGIALGAAMAVSTMLSFFWDHSGWIVGSTGLVMRPYFNKQVSRSLWRAGSIIIGMVIISVAYYYIPEITRTGIFAMIAILLLAGFHKSTAYITPFFVTFMTFSFLLYPGSNDKLIAQYLLERIVWVLLGIVIAFIFGQIFMLVRKIRDKKTVV
ncbi:FUSC family protein [Culicoidibacter larvae]|uniref:FUSC family protein n=1 Tax=Culicoidibacter larvae TaxID=2579976 RepID=A0A5R8QAE8_9FIRM|nr:FUSC family protein [Culicoidibacter larvae]TLG72883.1 FUSC family protein [Culicoidibacter larvae]